MRHNFPEDDELGMPAQRAFDHIERLSRASSNRIVPTTIVANYAVLETDDWIINNKPTTGCVLTLLDPVMYPGYYIKVLTYQAFGVTSSVANVVPITGGAAGTAIIGTTAGKFVEMISDGTNWIIVRAN